MEGNIEVFTRENTQCMGLELCDNCGDRVVKGTCQNEDCGKGGQVIPSHVDHLEVGILNYYNYSAAAGVLHPTRYMAIERAYRAVFIYSPKTSNYDYLKSLGPSASEDRANALVRILSGLIQRSGGIHATDANAIRIQDIEHIREKYGATKDYRSK